jgi:tetratricopeptide (TPR) repeat protein
MAHNNRGAVYCEKGDMDKGIADFNQAIRLDTNYGNAYGNRGYVYYTKDDYVHARADWERALQLDPNDKNILDLMGLLRKQGN